MAKLVELSDAWNAPCVNSEVIAAFLTPRPTWAPTGFWMPFAVVVLVWIS